jgi:acyl-CoA thioester hydrolase
VDEFLAGFPIVIEQSVDWADQDPYQHVNNAVYFRYFENARIEYIRRLDWFTFQKETGVGPILATTQARFRRAVTYPDKLLVGARISALAGDRFTMDYRIVSTKQADLVTLGDGVIVAYHYEEERKVPIPDELRARIERIEGKLFT